jgi:tetratricopeptide (TPR) repeat protein
MPANRKSHRVRLPAALAAILVLSAVPAAADSDLSERLTDQILELHRVNFNYRLESEFQQQKNLLGSQETAERAEKLRGLLKKRAAIYEAVAEFDRAEDDFNEMVAVRPQNPDVYYDRGYFYLRQSRFADAVHDFMTGSRLAPTQATFSYGAGRAFDLMGDGDDALQQYDEAIRLAPRDSAPVLARADLLLHLGRYGEARADYDRALTLGLARADRFFGYFGRGYARIFTGDYNGAVRDMDAALAARPGMINAVVWRGYVRERLGQRDLALEDYEAALRLSPKNDWIRSSISRMRS